MTTEPPAPANSTPATDTASADSASSALASSALASSDKPAGTKSAEAGPPASAPTSPAPAGVTTTPSSTAAAPDAEPALSKVAPATKPDPADKASTDGTDKDETGASTDKVSTDKAETDKGDETGAGASKPGKAEKTEAEKTEKDGKAENDGDGDKAEKGAASETEAAKPPRDPFTSFAPEPEREPGRLQRIGRAIGRFVIHERFLAVVGSLALAVLMTWPTLRYPQHTLPQDIWDPTLQAWQMAWSGHILLSDPTQLWNANAFYPERLSFAFSDTLLGYAPAGMLGDGPTAAVLRYNIMFVLAHALATLGAYALVRQLGAGRTGAIVAAAAYTYAPWMLSQAGHLHIVSNGGIPLALAMLARGHGYSFRHGYRPDRRHAGWALLGWLVAAWQISLGFGIGLPFAYVLALLGVAAIVAWFWRKARRWAVKRPFGIRLALADVVGGALFAATGALMSLPYFEVAHQHPEAARTVNDLKAYSPPPSGFFIAPPESLVWGDLHESARAGLPWAPEMTLLPGFVLYGLALAGLFFSVWKLRHRLLLLAGVLVSGILAMGPRFFGGTYTYLPLFNNLPGWDGLRTPGRLMLWTSLLLGILAAGAVSAFVRRIEEISVMRVPPRPQPWLRLLTFVPLALVLVEGLNTTPHPIVPQQPAVMRVDEGPILVLPSTLKIDQNVMLWSTTRFQPIVNGGSGFTPTRQEEVREITRSFPDQASVDYLREMGVKTVVLLRDQISGTPWQAAADLSVDNLGIEREDAGDTIIFRL
ncbi:hypothetical protein K1W54_34945 [Micromonospora sp. CPCC 205371]|nr:hypothetical protein [Micromonospora sp. CPCC 205371]